MFIFHTQHPLPVIHRKRGVDHTSTATIRPTRPKMARHGSELAYRLTVIPVREKLQGLKVGRLAKETRTAVGQ